MVFTWHFTHGTSGYPVPLEIAPDLFPLSVLDEGHTGVALFMTLSGYLFARLLDGRQIRYAPFLWNRALRLLPLLSVVVVIAGIRVVLRGESLVGYLGSLAKGVLLPSLPNGGWSITVEGHYYLVLPALLWMTRRSKLLPWALIAVAIALRFVIHHEQGEVQWLAYWTIVGRIDQFVMGMLAFTLRNHVAHRHVTVLLIALGFTYFYWLFDQEGGFYQRPTYPSPSPLWIVLPTIEALAYGVLIGWYDSSFAPSDRGVARFLSRIGAYSYSIYLLHFFVVFRGARFIHEQVMDISNFYVACAWAVPCFALMAIPGYLSYRFIEAPFLRLRKTYISRPGTPGALAA